METSREPYTSTNRMGPISKYLHAKDYMDMHNIPQMFQSLVASLMMEKPENPIQYLDTKLEAIKEMGVENVDWESFIYQHHPMRDPIRNELIKTEDTTEGKKKGQDPFADDHILHPVDSSTESFKPADSSTENYKPELFNLTEPQDEEQSDIL